MLLYLRALSVLPSFTTILRVLHHNSSTGQQATYYRGQRTVRGPTRYVPRSSARRVKLEIAFPGSSRTLHDGS